MPMDAEAALAQAASEVDANYHPIGPSGNAHVPEWLPKPEGGQYLGGSTLVKQRASTYFDRIHHRLLDDIDGYHGLRGNLLCDQLGLKHLAWKEVQARVPFPRHPDWDLVVHLDGLKLFGATAVGYEHKAHGWPSESDIELARRQNILGIAALEWQYENGQRFFPFARWTEQGRNGLGCTLPDGITDWATIVALAPIRASDAKAHPFATTRDERRDILGTYLAKGDAILDAHLSNDNAPALAWERSPLGLREFTEKIEVAMLPPPQLEELHGDARLVADQDQAESSKARIKAAMSACGAREARFPGGLVATLTSNNQLRMRRT